MTARAAIALLLASAVAVAVPVPKAVKAKRPNLDGRWEAVEMRSGNQDTLDSNFWVWQVNGEELQALDRLRHNSPPKPMTPGATFTLVAPPGGGVNEINYCCKGPGYDIRSPALVEVWEDEFAICWPISDTRRPKEVKPGDGMNYVRFKRVTEK